MKRNGTIFGAVLVIMLAAGPADAQAPIGPEKMLETVRYLASPEMRGRAIGSPELDRAAAFIASKFESAGLMPGGEPGGSWYQEWTDPATGVVMRNVVGVLPGRNPELARESVVIGAHYDHLGTKGASKADDGRVHPGADDNASGVAMLIELASRMPLVEDMERPVVFVAFTGEETGRKGSRHYVRNEKRHPASRAAGMINLDTVGRLGKGKLVVLNAGSAREWAGLFVEAGKALEFAVAPSAQDLDASDQTSFLEAGVPAVQLFTGPHADYHRPTDTPDKIDGGGLAKIAMAVRAVAYHLATKPAPLTRTVTAPPFAPSAPSAPAGERKVTIGAVPDFTYNEKGVRLGGTTPGGPAEAAGLRQGDVIVQAGGSPIVGLKDLSEVLRTKQPGEKLPVRFLRQGKELQAVVEVKEK